MSESGDARAAPAPRGLSPSAGRPGREEGRAGGADCRSHEQRRLARPDRRTRGRVGEALAELHSPVARPRPRRPSSPRSNGSTRRWPASFDSMYSEKSLSNLKAIDQVVKMVRGLDRCHRSAPRPGRSARRAAQEFPRNALAAQPFENIGNGDGQALSGVGMNLGWRCVRLGSAAVMLGSLARVLASLRARDL
jgi:hypothetical protein